MPDHLHWIFKLAELLNLSEVVQRLKGRTSKELAPWKHGEGAFWEAGFYDHGIRVDGNLFEKANYILLNPARDELVADLEHYPYWDACWIG